VSTSFTKNIGFLIFDGVQSLDLLGPLEVFQETNEYKNTKPQSYRTILISEDGEPITTSSGVTILAQASLESHPPLHTLIVPGGGQARNPNFSVKSLEWLALTAPQTYRYGSICTGLFILARTGLIKGSAVITHWAHIEEAKNTFPMLNVVDDALFLRDGKLFTAAGITAGIDLALSLVDEDFGPTVASQIARQLVVFLKRSGDQRQYSSTLQHQHQAKGDFADLLAWISDNLDHELSSTALAERVNLSERQFRRRFKKLVKETPTRYIERLRVESAATLLLNQTSQIDTIAYQMGFKNPDTFRRAFARIKGVSPADYRQHFKGLQNAKK